MKLKRQPRQPETADSFAARTVAHYLTLSLFLMTCLVIAITPADPPPKAAQAQPEAEEESWLDKAAELLGKLL